MHVICMRMWMGMSWSARPLGMPWPRLVMDTAVSAQGRGKEVGHVTVRRAPQRCSKWVIRSFGNRTAQVRKVPL